MDKTEWFHLKARFKYLDPHVFVNSFVLPVVVAFHQYKADFSPALFPSAELGDFLVPVTMEHVSVDH